MKAFIRKEPSGEFPNVNMYYAYDGFKRLGAEIVFFTDIDELDIDIDNDILISGIGDTRMIFDKFGIDYPNMEYPESISNNKYLGRKIWKDTFGHVMSDKSLWHVFIKPVEGGKKFTGTVVNKIEDFRACYEADGDTEIWCSEIVDFISEYRCFIRYGELLGMKHYVGDPFAVPSRNILDSIISEYKDQPSAYGIDLGVTSDGKTVLVEVNDGYSIGCYGLDSIKYARLLETRWAQLTKNTDTFIW